MEFAEIVYTEPLTGMEAGPLWQQLRDHEHDPITAVCVRCGRAKCVKFTAARRELVANGLLLEDES